MIKKLDLKHLNKQQWFRVLKTFYIGLFAVSILFTAADSFSIFKPTLDPKNSYLTCSNGQKVPLGEHNFQITNKALSSSDDMAARRLCMSDAQIGSLARENGFFLASDIDSDEVLGQKIRTEQNFIYQNMFMNITPKETNYELTEVYVKRSIFVILAWLFLPIMIITTIFEIVRRIFYYIVLDTFIPEKWERYLFFKLKH
jgi:hypothetical protein